MIFHVACSDLVISPSQPRTVFDPGDIEELASSIAQFGVLSPLLARQVEGGQWLLIAGERRLRAAQLAGLDTVPVWQAPQGADDAVLALVENVQRVDLNPLEEAHAYRNLIEGHGLTQEDVATAVGKSRTHVSSTIALLRLPEDVARRVAAGVITPGHARVLVTLPAEACSALATRIVNEGLSVAATREAVLLGELGEQDDKAAVRRRKPPRSLAAAPQRLEQLEDYLGTRVSIRGVKKGTVSIHFAGEEDLNRIVDLLMAANVNSPQH